MPRIAKFHFNTSRVRLEALAPIARTTRCGDFNTSRVRLEAHSA